MNFYQNEECVSGQRNNRAKNILELDRREGYLSQTQIQSLYGRNAFAYTALNKICTECVAYKNHQGKTFLRLDSTPPSQPQILRLHGSPEGCSLEPTRLRDFGNALSFRYSVTWRKVCLYVRNIFFQSVRWDHTIKDIDGFHSQNKTSSDCKRNLVIATINKIWCFISKIPNDVLPTTARCNVCNFVLIFV